MPLGNGPFQTVSLVLSIHEAIIEFRFHGIFLWKHFLKVMSYIIILYKPSSLYEKETNKSFEMQSCFEKINAYNSELSFNHYVQSSLPTALLAQLVRALVSRER